MRHEIVKLRHNTTATKGGYSLGVPAFIGDALPAGMRFSVHLTDEGLLYKPIKADTDASGETPAWVQEASS